MPTIEEMKMAYDKHKNLKLAADEVGMKWQTLYWYLKKHNHHISSDKSRYGSATDKFAAKAEQDFKQLVPSAKDMNSTIFQSKYDFKIHGLKVDVKASQLHQGNKGKPNLRWAFSLKKQEMLADFIVGMAYKDEKIVKLYLFPAEQIRFRSTISISENGSSKWRDFEISPDDLKAFFEKTILN
ncbi:hypothetical protein MIS33_07550 [Wielerella bovis]|uniref:hypothetical protein n=1 Tax=Wielerella bovis TaxID=2917790 RepID=UPI00201937AA|nr:hypothetical protein [Wielerella bovis]ULJ64016.1 hypothetical protein MIS33_07550 [Wielerella bovis]